MTKYLEDKKGSAFDPKTPLGSTTTNILLSILLNLRYPWGSDELKRVVKITEEFMDSGMEAFTLTFLNQYIPTFLIKLFFKSKMESCKSKVSNLKDFIREQIESHEATLDPKESRDLIDIFLNAGKSETGMNKFSSTISAFFPDGATTTSRCNELDHSVFGIQSGRSKKGTKRNRPGTYVYVLHNFVELLSTSEVKQDTN